MTGDFWSVVRGGGIYSVVGSPPPDPPAGLALVRVRCGGPRSPLRPLRDAIALIDQRVGQRAVFERTARRVRRGLRDHLLGDPSDQGRGDIVAALNRLGQSAIVIEGIEHADPDTLSLLRHIAARPGWLQPALILCARQVPVDGDGAVLFALATPLTDSEEPATSEELPELPPEARRVLRAAALIGSGFDAVTLSRLLDVPLLRVLEALQGARDAGAPLDDLGEGRLQLPPSVVAQLRGELMPSLVQAYSRRLATMSTPAEPTPLPTPVVAPEPPAFSTETIDVEAEVIGAAPKPLPPRTEGGGEDDVVDVEPLDDGFEDIVAPPAAESADPEDGVGLDEVLEQGRGAEASSHHRHAGALSAATAAWLAAAAAADPFALIDTIEHGTELLAALEASGRPQDVLAAVTVQAQLGGLKLEGSSPQGVFRIDDALADLRAATAAAEACAAPVLLRAQVRARLALGLYDRGGAADLEEALTALTEAIRMLMEDGQPLEAARLLNEQAAVWIRLGDPVRAVGLLKQSQAVFSEHRDRPESAIELAETYLLLARLPLHVAARAGSRDKALSAALGHAHDARRLYERHGLRREAARARSTAGRLHLEAGDLRRAAAELSAALEVQQQLGDALGMARSTGALAELLGQAGRIVEAEDLLASSVQLNFARGSVRGLAYNAETLRALQAAGGGGAVERMLGRAQTVLGE
ncbi:MAG: tetratricopeptide (TPR) repeat protein [Myxococcota bacterium]|jgi:tetratricopeptide (TPR) repeat protein